MGLHAGITARWRGSASTLAGGSPRPEYAQHEGTCIIPTVRQASITKTVIGVNLSKADAERVAARALSDLGELKDWHLPPFSVQDGETDVRANTMDELLQELG